MGNANACVNEIQNKYSKGWDGKTSGRGNTQSYWKALDSLDIGINVVPIKNPIDTISQGKSIVPWDKARCSSKNTIKPPLKGTIKRSDTILLKSFNYTIKTGRYCA